MRPLLSSRNSDVVLSFADLTIGCCCWRWRRRLLRRRPRRRLRRLQQPLMSLHCEVPIQVVNEVLRLYGLVMGCDCLLPVPKLNRAIKVCPRGMDRRPPPPPSTARNRRHGRIRPLHAPLLGCAGCGLCSIHSAPYRSCKYLYDHNKTLEIYLSLKST